MNQQDAEDVATESSASHPQPTVVGLGASAGGLAALKLFFQHIPVGSGLAFVVVVHLSPEHKSLLADLLQPSVRFPVQQVTETVRLEADNVYVIPPNANLSAIDTHLRLSALEERRRERAPIDHFFRTLAATHDGHSIGVILTGTGSDGTLGLREIKAKGGLILVQDPNEAEFDSMPQSAISTGVVDRVLPVAEIADALVRVASVGARLTLQAEAAEPEQPERLLLPKVITILRTRAERDFSRYKPATILRRIARRMQLNYIEDFAHYVEVLREQPNEARALADDLLITVTSFFRDSAVFQKLEQEIVPHLFAGKGPGDTVRVWSVGCATGEEAYSVGMLLLEEASRIPNPPGIQIFASDLHKHSLHGAREGLYSGDIETDVGPERIARFFRKESGGYRICKEVRDTVVFAPHNLLGDPPFSRLDFITCRNLLIYLNRNVQRDVIDLFHYALCPNGYLLLGSAETTDAAELFRTEDKKLCIYRKRNVPAPEPRLPVFPLTRLRTPGDLAETKPDVTTTSTTSLPLQTMHASLLERYAPPSILIGPESRLLHLSEHAGRYLVHPGGEMTSSVMRLIRDELRIELQALLQLVRERREPVDSKPIAVRFNGHEVPVVMHVRPAEYPEQDGFALVIFEERQAPRPRAIEHPEGVLDGDLAQDGEVRRVAELEGEIDAARQRLQTIIEEYETSQEEMKAANEEMQSTNEELRSTMEELETSKEELQSINEELQTVNQENRHKVDELSQLSSDLQNLLAATDIATLFLDRELRIMRFTPRLAELFSIRVVDRGRPITDLTHRLGYSQLRGDAEAVLDKLVPVEREIVDNQGRWYFTRVLPYRSTEQRIEGVVITFIEITARKRVEEALRQSEVRYRALSTAGNHPTYRMSPDWRRMNQLHGNNILADTVEPVENWADNYLLPEDRPKIMEVVERAIEAKALFELEHRVWFADGKVGWVLSRAIPILSPSGEIEEWFGSTVNITARKQAEAALRASELRQGFLLKLSDALRDLWDTSEIRSKACALLGEQFEVDRTYYLEIDEAAGVARVEGEFVRNDALSIAGEHSIADFAWSVTILRRGECHVVNDTQSSSLVPAADRSASAALGIIACMGAPVIKSRHLVGALCVTSARVRDWQEEEVELFREVSERLREALERARAEAALRESEERQAFLLKLADVLRSLSDPIEIQKTAVQVLGEHLAVNRALYLEVMPDFDTLQVGPAYVQGVEPIAATMRMMEFGSTLSAQYQSGKTIVLDDALAPSGETRVEINAVKRIQVRAAIGVPMIKDGRLMAILTVHHATPRRWSRLDVQLVEEVAQRTWAAMERARAEAALRDSEESQRTLLEGIPQLVSRSKDHGYWTWSSPQWQEFTGQTQEQSLGRGWLSVIDPDNIEQTLQALEHATARGRLDVEYGIRHAKTGKYRCHHSRSVPIHGAQGEVLEWLGTSTDIEDLKRAERDRRNLEEQFRLFVKNVQEYGLVQTDAAGRITNWNPGAERLLGFAPEEIIGKSFSVLLTPEDQESGVFSRELAHVSEGNRNEDARWFIRKDGSRFWVRWITEPIEDESGRFLGLAKIMRDETERERAAAFTKDALAEKEELLKEVHHRVKNNLQVITSLLNLQADQIKDRHILSAFDEARSRVASIAAIHELLYRSSSMAAIKLVDYARQFAPNLIEFYGLQQQIQVEVTGNGAILELERAVPYGLLLNELLSNSLKHAFPEQRRGRIRITLKEEDQKTVLQVSDDGIGMPAGLDVGSAPSLGLKLVQRLARQLHGAVSFQQGEPGTTIEVRFPTIKPA